MIKVTDTAAKKIKQNLTKRGAGVGIRIGARRRRYRDFDGES